MQYATLFLIFILTSQRAASSSWAAWVHREHRRVPAHSGCCLVMKPSLARRWCWIMLCYLFLKGGYPLPKHCLIFSGATKHQQQTKSCCFTLKVNTFSFGHIGTFPFCFALNFIWQLFLSHFFFCSSQASLGFWLSTWKYCFIYSYTSSLWKHHPSFFISVT